MENIAWGSSSPRPLSSTDRVRVAASHWKATQLAPARRAFCISSANTVAVLVKAFLRCRTRLAAFTVSFTVSFMVSLRWFEVGETRTPVGE